MTKCVRFSAVLLFVFAIAFFATACGDCGSDATSASYFVPLAPSPTEPVPEPTADPAVDPTPDPTVDPMPDPEPEPTPTYMKFGRYPQTASGDVEDIEWLVLSVEDDRVLAISRYGLDARRFDDNSNEWGSSEIRGWLNGEFYNDSFNDDEKGIIASSDPGKVFLLSKDEAGRYFSSDDDRKCGPTEYAEAKGTSVYENGCCYWWLRSPDPDLGKYVYSVIYDGDVHSIYASSDDLSVRPALWINLESE